MICFIVKYSIVGQLVEIVIVGNWDSAKRTKPKISGVIGPDRSVQLETIL
ncbi:unnamed protein product [Arabidopsis halleri]